METKNRTPLIINTVLLATVAGAGWYFYENGNTNAAVTSLIFCVFMTFMIFKNSRPSEKQRLKLPDIIELRMTAVQAGEMDKALLAAKR